jgi:thiamine-phosphate pyrophosphorylase
MSHSDQVSALIDAGATLIQLREKTASPRDFFEAARASVAIARSRGAKIVINDRVDFALMADADGVHLGQDDLPPEKAREILGPRAIIGCSTHNLEQAVEAITHGVDYIAIGPVYPTTTKADPDPTVGPEGIHQVRKAIGNTPLVAIGGINSTNLLSVLEAGADSAAVIGQLFTGENGISANFRRLAEIAEK